MYSSIRTGESKFAWSQSIRSISSRIDVTPALRDYVQSKLERLTRHSDHLHDGHVILSVEKLRQKIEANVRVRGRDIFCESAEADMYAAIDSLVDKLDRTIIKHKEKNLEHRYDGAPIKHFGTE